MYYYYYYYGEHLTEISINLRLKHEDGPKDIGLSELTDFLNSIEELNKRVIYLSQPEYRFPDSMGGYGQTALLGYHQLKLKTINRENPFNLVLTMQLASFGNAHYWAIWKILIHICKKYGKSSTNLDKTIMSIWDYLEKLYSDLKPEKRNRIISDVLGVNSDSPKTEEIISNLKRMIHILLTDADTQKYYEYFCNGMFTIDKAIGTCDLFGFDIDLISEGD